MITVSSSDVMILRSPWRQPGVSSQPCVTSIYNTKCQNYKVNWLFITGRLFPIDEEYPVVVWVFARDKFEPHIDILFPYVFPVDIINNFFVF